MHALETSLRGYHTANSYLLNDLAVFKNKALADQKEVDRIKTHGGIYRFPQEPTVWLVRGGKRYRIKNPVDFSILEPGRTTDDAETNEHIASIPVEAGSELR